MLHSDGLKYLSESLWLLPVQLWLGGSDDECDSSGRAHVKLQKRCTGFEGGSGAGELRQDLAMGILLRGPLPDIPGLPVHFDHTGEDADCAPTCAVVAGGKCSLRRCGTPLKPHATMTCSGSLG